MSQRPWIVKCDWAISLKLQIQYEEIRRDTLMFSALSKPLKVITLILSSIASAVTPHLVSFPPLPRQKLIVLCISVNDILLLPEAYNIPYRLRRICNPLSETILPLWC
jgi:hypothetical protein